MSGSGPVLSQRLLRANQGVWDAMQAHRFVDTAILVFGQALGARFGHALEREIAFHEAAYDDAWPVRRRERDAQP